MQRIDTISLLMIHCLRALTDRHYCQYCLFSIQYKLNPLYWPHLPLEYGLEKYFPLESSKKKLFENLLRTIHDCRFFLEEAVFRIQEVSQDLVYHTLHDSCMTVLLELRFGIFRTHVPRIKTFQTLTEYGLKVKTMSIQRFFYPKIRNWIRKLTSCGKINENFLPCTHEASSLKFPQMAYTDQWVIYPSQSKYHMCRICVENESTTCPH